MKAKWLLVLAAALVVACQKPTTPPAPVGSSPDGNAVASDGNPVAGEKPAEAGKTGEAVAKTEGSGGEVPTTPAKPTEPAVNGAEQIATLASGFSAEIVAFNEKMQKATAEERRTLISERPDASAVYAKIKEVMDSSDDPQVRLEGLLFASQNLRDADAVEELVTKHASNEKVLPLVMQIGRMVPRKAEGILESLINSDADPKAKAVGMFALGDLLQESNSARAEELLVRVTKDHGDVEIGGRKLSEMAAPTLFVIQRLGIGKEAPDIEANDLDGVSFKLSDYRGKVVVIDFWGDW